MFLEFSKQNRERWGGGGGGGVGGGGAEQNNRPINLPKVITFFTDYNYTT